MEPVVFSRYILRSTESIKKRMCGLVFVFVVIMVPFVLCRRAAIGSGVALAAHVVFSERARRQAGSMLRGSVLAALAGTGTVCAGLAYFNPTTQAANADADADSDADSAGPPRTQPNAPRTAVAAADPPPLRRRWYGDDSAVRRGSALDAAPVRVRENGSRDLRLTIFRAGLRRWIANLSPNAQRLVRVRRGGGEGGGGPLFF